MIARLIRHLAVLGLLVLSPSTGQAQDATRDLRILWEVDQPVSGLQTVCGRVFNDGPMDARRVRVRVEGMDERGSVTGRRDGDVGQVWSRSIGRFCLTMSAGPATYQVTIIGAEWMAGTQAP